ncbi:MAG: hypothetical protein JST41_05270 [Bacteroidetes bacterium]|nr:hypothetical protein [Bacteroidota bacterium]MBX7127837.1 hypothetical protein [Flavobacteriales bacterium]HMU13049.1 hypothetical protein [Flavobacteriales bacterium]HNE79942.1 hypothetical protein [Flavobacteriales bacterium]HNI03177.1 hypothetical protein [Flavobacteriales bacterium]
MRPSRHIALLFALFATIALFAQPAVLVEANKFYQAGDLKSARAILDGAVKDPVIGGGPEAWVLRGFVYKDLYKAHPGDAGADALRDEALNSLYRCTVLDTAEQFAKSSVQAYDYLCKTQYNDAARALNELDDVRALSLYAAYKSNVLRTDPGHDLSGRDVEFNNALATVYTKRFNADREDTAWFNKATTLYHGVLAIDPDNYGANYNLATLYYNRGVYNIQRINASTDLPTIGQVQEVSKEFFMQALPYMEKAQAMNPKRRETLLGLEGIYYSLQNTDKSEEFRHKYEALDQEAQPLPPEAPKEK